MIFNFTGKAFGRKARLIGASLFSLALLSCGGGGGSAGTVPNSPGTVVNVASLTLTFSSNQLVSTTVTPVTVTAIAEDANHNGLANVTVTFSADSGEIIPTKTPAVTDSTGTVTATLGTGGDVTPRTIHISVTGGGKTATGTVAVVGSSSGQPTITLLFSAPTLASAGTAGTEVTVTAQIKDANSNALAGVPVIFTADSGILVVTQATSNASGLATATLGTAGNPTDRVINVVASGSGATSKGAINVTGTTITASSTSTALTINTISKFTFNVQDSSGKSIPNVPVTFSSAAGNTITADPTDAGTTVTPLTDSNGNIVLDVASTLVGQDTLTVNAGGASSKVGFTTTSQSLAVTLSDNKTSPSTVLNILPQPLPEYTATSCIQVDATYVNSGGSSAATAFVSTSRGVLYTNSTCTAALSGVSVPFNSAGIMQTLYLKSLTVGTATVTVSEVNGTVAGPTQSASVGFTAQLVNTATPSITLIASETTVGPNTNVSPSAQSSVLTATVRDGTTNNNLVQGVPVEFTLVSDSSGGRISPSVVITQANGQAQTTYFPGTGTTAQNGVKVQAAIQSTVATNSVQTSLTVAGTALFVSIGTGNQISAPDTNTYAQTWAVFVTDSAGNPVVGANVEGTLIATSYSKGSLIFSSNVWQYNSATLPTDGLNLAGTGPGVWCPNTDASNNGIWSPSNPYQIYYPTPYLPDPALAGTIFKFVEPGIPGNVTSSGLTNTSGYATLTVTYLKDHAVWTNASLTVTASAQGTNSIATAAMTPMSVLASDFSNASISPPGQISPYGVNRCGIAF